MAPKQPEGVREGQVPPQLAALAEHRADPAHENRALPHRFEAADLHPSGGRHEDAHQHLDGGRLSGTVGADVAEALAGIDAEGHVGDSRHDVAAAPEATRLVPHHEVTAQALDLDDHEPAPT